MARDRQTGASTVSRRRGKTGTMGRGMNNVPRTEEKYSVKRGLERGWEGFCRRLAESIVIPLLFRGAARRLDAERWTVRERKREKEREEGTVTREGGSVWIRLKFRARASRPPPLDSYGLLIIPENYRRLWPSRVPQPPCMTDIILILRGYVKTDVINRSGWRLGRICCNQLPLAFLLRTKIILVRGLRVTEISSYRLICFANLDSNSRTSSVCTSFPLRASLFCDRSIQLELFVWRTGRLTSPEDAWTTTFVEEAGRGIKYGEERSREGKFWKREFPRRYMHRPQVEENRRKASFLGSRVFIERLKMYEPPCYSVVRSFHQVPICLTHREPSPGMNIFIVKRTPIFYIDPCSSW